MAPEQLAELRALYARATPGPWEVGGPNPSVSVITMVDGGCGGEYPEPPQYEAIAMLHQSIDYTEESPPQAVSDATLIAACVNALPDLLAAAERAVLLERELRRVAVEEFRGFDEISGYMKVRICRICGAKRLNGTLAHAPGCVLGGET